MLLVISMVLAVLPLAGIALLIYANPELTVDNLFMSLMLLTISGIFGVDVVMELRDLGLPIPGLKPAKAAGAGASAFSGGPLTLPGGAIRDGGVVEHVAYYESGIGQSNRCIVLLRNGKGPRLVAFRGDVRDQFPLGRRVEVVYSQAAEGNTLLERKLA